MKNLILTLMAVGFLVGCGGSGDKTVQEDPIDTPQSSQEAELKTLSKVHKDPILQDIISADFSNLLEDTTSFSKDTYIEYYKRMNALRFISKPDLKVIFDLKDKEQKSLRAGKIDRKLIYESQGERQDEYTCYSGGTVQKHVKKPRTTLEADNYKAGDFTKYDYNECNIGNVKYNGKVEYSVGTSNLGNDIHFNSTFGLTPIGTFESRFNHMSMETESQKIVLNGTIKYKAKTKNTPEPNSKLIYLEKKYYTVGDFEVTVYDKMTGETIKLIYNGTLDKVTYSDTNAVGETDASVIDLGVIGKFAYRRTSDYSLRVESGTKMFTVDVNDNISGLVGEDGSMEPPRSIGYDATNSSNLAISNHNITQQVLADGTVRYILDINTDFHVDANEVIGSPTHALPLSDVDLMQGVVVIGFDTCYPTNRVRQYFKDLDIEYSYINMKETQETYNVFKWFNAVGVPYVGINGNFFGAAGYDKGHFATLLNLYGYDMDELLIDQAYEEKNAFKSASGWFKDNFDDLQTKDKHTAMAVANDTPRSYLRFRTWNYSSAQKAKEHALKRCEEIRKTRKERGKREIHSKCRLYSVDGEIQPISILREVP